MLGTLARRSWTAVLPLFQGAADGRADLADSRADLADGRTDRVAHLVTQPSDQPFLGNDPEFRPAQAPQAQARPSRSHNGLAGGQTDAAPTPSHQGTRGTTQLECDPYRTELSGQM